MKAFVLAVVALASPAMAEDQFDLSCSGHAIGGTRSGAFSDDFKENYRIDLAQAKWCKGDCKAVRSIANLQPTEITFILEKSDNSSYREAVDRESGSLSIESVTDNLVPFRRSTLSVTAKCEPKPFSGFPKIETKF